MDDSPLGRLPAELRNQIYGLVMYESIPIHVGLKNAKRAKDALSMHRWGRKIMTGLALVLTCRQIYQESSSLYFAINTFEFSNTAAVRAFVKRFGEEKVHALRDLTIERFAVTTVPLQGAFKGNEAARKHLRLIAAYTKRYGWRSVKVTAEFLISYLREFICFDLMDPEKPWETLRTNQKLDLNTKYPKYPHIPMECVESVYEEIKAWRELFQELLH